MRYVSLSIGGEGGIRTREPLWVTRFPSVRAKPDYATSPFLRLANYTTCYLYGNIRIGRFLGLYMPVIALNIYNSWDKETAHTDHQIQNTCDPKPGLVAGRIRDGTSNDQTKWHHCLRYAAYY